MGVYKRIRLQLASGDVAFASAGLSVVRTGSMGASLDKYSVARGERGVSVSCMATDDRSGMEKRVRGGIIRFASHPGGIRGVGGGAKGCFERVVFYAGDLGVCPGETLHSSLLTLHSKLVGSGFLCAGIDVKADGGDFAVCVVIAGLLAAAKK